MAKQTEKEKARIEAAYMGAQAIACITSGDSERAGALAMFAIRWAKRSLGSKR